MNRVFLRELVHADITDMYLSWFRNNDVTSFLEVDGKSLTQQMVCEYIDEGRTSNSYFMYAICLEEDKRHIGNLKVGPINYKHRVADLVCVIGDRSEWGKGLATDAIAQGNQLAFEKYEIRKLHGQIYADNIGSVKAYCKAGWIVEGVIEGRYLTETGSMDQILVSCNNPKYLHAEQNNYNLEKLAEWIAFRKQFTNPAP
ncbi:MAG: GNAT family protein [Flavobacteriales bacterium]|nr:GNAT family protein [Flavobacteriales bacterium]